MTNFCAYQNIFRGNRYEPPEAWCELNFDEEYDCDTCPFRISKEDYDEAEVDRNHDRLSFDFLKKF